MGTIVNDSPAQIEPLFTEIVGDGLTVTVIGSLALPEQVPVSSAKNELTPDPSVDVVRIEPEPIAIVEVAEIYHVIVPEPDACSVAPDPLQTDLFVSGVTSTGNITAQAKNRAKTG